MTLYSGSIYIPPEGCKYLQLESNLIDFRKEFSHTNILLAGDFNAMIGNRLDYILEDTTDYLSSLEDAEYTTDDFDKPRSSKDNEVNNFDHKLLNICHIFGIHCLNGRFSGDTGGDYTCITLNGASIVDYILVSSNIFNLIQEFYVVTRTESDHQPLECSIKCNINLDITVSNIQTTEYTKYIWKEESASDYKN